MTVFFRCDLLRNFQAFASQPIFTKHNHHSAQHAVSSLHVRRSHACVVMPFCVELLRHNKRTSLADHFTFPFVPLHIYPRPRIYGRRTRTCLREAAPENQDAVCLLSCMHKYSTLTAWLPVILRPSLSDSLTLAKLASRAFCLSGAFLVLHHEKLSNLTQCFLTHLATQVVSTWSLMRHE